jgi:hypothetical protein
VDEAKGVGRAPPGDREQLKLALGVLAVNPNAKPSVPLSYALDRLDRRYGQPPGAHRDWDDEDLLRALAFQTIEASVQVSDG